MDKVREFKTAFDFEHSGAVIQCAVTLLAVALQLIFNEPAHSEISIRPLHRGEPCWRPSAARFLVFSLPCPSSVRRAARCTLRASSRGAEGVAAAVTGLFRSRCCSSEPLQNAVPPSPSARLATLQTHAQVRREERAAIALLRQAFCGLYTSRKARSRTTHTRHHDRQQTAAIHVPHTSKTQGARDSAREESGHLSVSPDSHSGFRALDATRSDSSQRLDTGAVRKDRRCGHACEHHTDRPAMCASLPSTAAAAACTHE